MTETTEQKGPLHIYLNARSQNAVGNRCCSAEHLDHVTTYLQMTQIQCVPRRREDGVYVVMMTEQIGTMGRTEILGRFGSSGKVLIPSQLAVTVEGTCSCT